MTGESDENGAMSDLADLAHAVVLPGIRAVALMGSATRGRLTKYSDLDIVRFRPGNHALSIPAHSFYHRGRLVVVSSVDQPHWERWFTEPEEAVPVINGLRRAVALFDPDGLLARLLARAHAFTWTPEMQEKADRWVSRQLVGWIEEVHKGLGGLERHDVGRLLNARFGLSWGMARVMAVGNGVLLEGDNDVYQSIQNTIGLQSSWSRLCRAAFGVTGADILETAVAAGLLLYVETVTLLTGALQPDDAPAIRTAVEHISSSPLIPGVL